MPAARCTGHASRPPRRAQAMRHARRGVMTRCEEARTDGYVPLRAHNIAPSKADTPRNHPNQAHNPPRGRTTSHPRRQIHRTTTPIRRAIPLEGAQTRTLDGRYTAQPPQSGAQSPSRAHNIAPSTAHTPHRSATRPSNPPPRAHNIAPSRADTPQKQPEHCHAPAEKSPTHYISAQSSSASRTRRSSHTRPRRPPDVSTSTPARSS